MNETDFKTMRTNAFAVFAALYMIDTSELAPEQLVDHQAQLANAHTVWAKLENARLEELNKVSAENVLNLQRSLSEMNTQVANGGKPADVLAAVGGLMNSVSEAVKGLLG